MAASVGKIAAPVGDGAVTWLRASVNRAPSHGGEESRGVFPLRATTTATEPKRDCASSKPSPNKRREQQAQQSSVGPSKYELQGPTI